jgi:hypothetical protein
MSRIRVATTAASLFLMMPLVACGGGGDEAAAQAVADSFSNQDEPEFEVTQKQADCVGDGFVDELGVDRLKEYGIVTESLGEADNPVGDQKLPQDDAEKAAGVMTECLDGAEMFKQTFSTGEELSPEAAECFDKVLTDELLEEYYTAAFAEGEESAVEALTPLEECTLG